MHTGISAVQHLRPLRGGAHSHLLRASDGACYVTKFQNNPQHVRVLANEMLATNLGLALGLSGCERSLVGRPFIHVEVNASQFLALAGERTSPMPAAEILWLLEAQFVGYRRRAVICG